MVLKPQSSVSRSPCQRCIRSECPDCKTNVRFPSLPRFSTSNNSKEPFRTGTPHPQTRCLLKHASGSSAGGVVREATPHPALKVQDNPVTLVPVEETVVQDEEAQQAYAAEHLVEEVQLDAAFEAGHPVLVHPELDCRFRQASRRSSSIESRYREDSSRSSALPSCLYCELPVDLPYELFCMKCVEMKKSARSFHPMRTI